MRNYSNESNGANSFFTSYKEGWKNRSGNDHISLFGCLKKFINSMIARYGTTNALLKGHVQFC
jgi:hypothetical protein